MKTERLHYEDPLRLAFDARVLGHGAHRGRASVLLDRSAFYPESGGQMADHGALSGIAVVDVQLDADGRVHHVLEGEPPAIGARVEGVIDEARRREHMALHTGQHALSHALLELHDAVTVSSRLGETTCTIDVDRSGLSLEDARRAEARVNALIDEDRAVRQLFPTDEELGRMTLRKPPPRAERVRVVVIEGFDITPCGGTHVTHTAQIGLMRVERVERYKGGTRITFVCGPRARRALFADADALRAVAGELDCAPGDALRVVRGLRGKLDDAREEAGTLRGQLAERWAEHLGDGRTVVATIEDAALLAPVAARLAVGERVVALAAPSPGGTAVLIARGPDATTDAGALLKRIAAIGGGKGGGRPELARGKLPPGVDWPALVSAAQD